MAVRLEHARCPSLIGAARLLAELAEDERTRRVRTPGRGELTIRGERAKDAATRVLSDLSAPSAARRRRGPRSARAQPPNQRLKGIARATPEFILWPSLCEDDQGTVTLVASGDANTFVVDNQRISTPPRACAMTEPLIAIRRECDRSRGSSLLPNIDRALALLSRSG
jgi:hypothetical protein